MQSKLMMQTLFGRHTNKFVMALVQDKRALLCPAKDPHTLAAEVGPGTIIDRDEPERAAGSRSSMTAEAQTGAQAVEAQSVAGSIHVCK